MFKIFDASAQFADGVHRQVKIKRIDSLEKIFQRPDSYSFFCEVR